MIEKGGENKLKYTSKLFVVFCLLTGLCGTVVMGCAPKATAPVSEEPAVEEETTAAEEETTAAEEAAPAAEEAAPAAEETTATAAEK